MYILTIVLVFSGSVQSFASELLICAVFEKNNANFIKLKRTFALFSYFMAQKTCYSLLLATKK